MPYSAVLLSIHSLHVFLYITNPRPSFNSPSLLCSLHSRPTSPFSCYIHPLPCRQAQGARKSVMLSAYRGFHGSAVKLHSVLPLLPRARGLASRKPFCSAILSRAISPMRFDDRGPSDAHEPAERFRFPRVSGIVPFDYLHPYSSPLLFRSSSSVHPVVHLSPSLPSSANLTLGPRRREIVQKFHPTLNLPSKRVTSSSV